jgi:hypothetical protein
LCRSPSDCKYHVIETRSIDQNAAIHDNQRPGRIDVAPVPPDKPTEGGYRRKYHRELGLILRWRLEIAKI